MQPVCVSQHRDARWYYNPETQEYLLRRGDTDMIRVAGASLPNPEDLFNARTVFFRMNSKKAEPAQETVELWKHYQGVLNANINE